MSFICRIRGSKNKPSSGLPGKPLDKKKGDKLIERQQSRFLRTAPFHRRTQIVEEYIQYDMPAVPAASVMLPANSQATPVSGAGNSQNLPSVGAPTGSTEAVNGTSVNLESPSSNAPSPLEDSHNSSQLENGTAMDPTMPTLSPHPPVVKHGDKEAIAQKPTQLDPNATQTVTNNNTTTVLVNGVTTDTNVFHKPQPNVLKIESVNACVSNSNLNSNSNNNNNIHWNQKSLDSTKANINSWLRSQQKQSDHKTFKRPCLPSLDSGHEDLVTDSLYNFESVSNW